MNVVVTYTSFTMNAFTACVVTVQNNYVLKIVIFVYMKFVLPNLPATCPNIIQTITSALL